MTDTPLRISSQCGVRLHTHILFYLLSFDAS